MATFLGRVAVAAAVLLATHALAEPGPIVHTHAGAVRGAIKGELHIFKGLPYALAPVGSLRWRPPRSFLPSLPSRQSFA